MIRTSSNNRNNRSINFIKQRWPWGCLLFLWLGCRDHTTHFEQTPDNMRRIDSARLLLKSGDLVFRNGIDEVSRAARSFNRIDTSFSHCGLVLIENDTPFVYHAIGGHYNPDQKLRRDPVKNFWSGAEIDRFAIYRYALAPAQTDSLTGIIHRYYGQGLKFDLYFNFLTDDQMYCSEFVFKCLDKCLDGELSTYIKAREWPFGISPDDLFLNPKSSLVKRVDFTR